MNLEKFDDKCVRIITTWGEVFEGVASYDDREYAFHEYGHDQEALRLTPIVFYKIDILSVISLVSQAFRYKNPQRWEKSTELRQFPLSPSFPSDACASV